MNAFKSLTLCALLTLSCLAAPPATAQSSGEPPAPPQLENEFFPPDLVMRFQKQIGLSEQQSAAILDAVRGTQGEMLELQWKLSPELEALRDTISRPKVDEGDVLERLRRITSLENQVKELQVLLMVRVKNALTPSQQDRLRELRR